MKQTIRQMRLARGWIQRHLADLTGIPYRRISDFECGRLGPTDAELVALMAVFGCTLHCLEFPPARPMGRPQVLARDLVERFRFVSKYDPAGQYPAQCHLPAARKAYPQLMSRLDAELGRRPEWQYHLAHAPGGSSLEVVAQLCELREGAQSARVSPLQIGYDSFPVTERDRLRVVGHCEVPALIRPEWVWIHQVTVRTPKRYTLDGLLLVLQPRRVFVNFEIDGRGHDPRWDEQRAEALGILTLRMTEADILAKVSLTQRLRELGLCVPGRAS